MRQYILIVILAVFSISMNAGFYLIGDFNKWNLPTADATNGALRFSPDPNVWQDVEGKVEINLPPGSHEFTLVEMNDETGKINFFANAISPDFVLTKVEGSDERADEWYCKQDHFHGEQPDWWTYPISKLFTYGKQFEEIKPYRINDWRGGTVVVSTANKGEVSFSSPVAPDYEPMTDKGVVYALAKVDDFEPVLIEMRYSIRSGYNTSVNLYGHKISVIFTTEKNLNPDPNNCWGLTSKRLMHYNEVKNKEYKDFHSDFVRGGQPFEVEFPATGCAIIVGSWTDNDSLVSLYEETQGDYVAELESDEQSWTETAFINPETGFFDPIEVTGKEVSILFKANTFKTHWTQEGAVKPFGKPGCDCSRLFTDEKMPQYDADKISVGGILPYAAQFDSTGTMTMTASPYYGIGYVSYDGEFRRAASIEEIPETALDSESFESENASVYYDLSGRPISNPQPGIYLIHRGGYWEKVILK